MKKLVAWLVAIAIPVAALAANSFGSQNGSRGDDVLYVTYTYNAQFSGGGGNNTLNYSRATSNPKRRVPVHVFVDLVSGRAASTAGNGGIDRLYGIQDVKVTDRNVKTVLIGDWRANHFYSNSPYTVVAGGPGDDTIEVVGGAHVNAGPGRDVITIRNGPNNVPVTINGYKAGEDRILNYSKHRVIVF